MNFKFIENSVIVIPFIYKGYRLEGSEKVRFRCLFRNTEGDFPYTLDMEEDNKGADDADGHYTITLDMGKYDILPGRYAFDLNLVLESGSLVTIKSKSECHIDIVTEAEGHYKPNGELYFGDDYVIAEGNSGLWTYRKWASGIAECWGSVTLGEETAHGLTVDSVWKVSSDQNLAFPQGLFSTKPIVTGVVYAPQAKGLLLRVSGTDKNSAYFRTMGMETDFPNKGTIVDISAKGKWK